jgi:hypothetical protein
MIGCTNTPQEEETVNPDEYWEQFYQDLSNRQRSEPPSSNDLPRRHVWQKWSLYGKDPQVVRTMLTDSLSSMGFVCFGTYSNPSYYNWACQNIVDNLGYYHDIGQIQWIRHEEAQDSMKVNIRFYGEDPLQSGNQFHGPYHMPMERAVSYHKTITAVRRHFELAENQQ